MKLNDLMLKNQGYSYSYDPNINPAIMNEFAASAYRWHSFVQVKFVGRQGERELIDNFIQLKIKNN